MRKRLPGTLTIYVSFLALFFTACKKYEEGGLIKKTDKNLTSGTWVLNKYLKNGVDKTSTLLISGYKENYSSNNVYTRNYTDKNGSPVIDDGRWLQDDENESLSISDVGSVEITQESGTVSSSYYKIIKLTDKEFWYYFDNGGARHEFRFNH